MSGVFVFVVVRVPVIMSDKPLSDMCLNNSILRSYRDVIVVANIVTRRTSKS